MKNLGIGIVGGSITTNLVYKIGYSKAMNKAIEILKEYGADGWVEKYKKELAALE